MQKAKSAVAPVKIVHQSSEPNKVQDSDKKEAGKVSESATEGKLSVLTNVYNPKGEQSLPESGK